jgi:nucleotide-binding universal stress UspA family protein
MKILVAVDGSAPSLAAVAALADRVRWFRDAVELTLLHAQSPIPYKAAATWVGHEAVARYYAEESDAALADAVKLLDARDVGFSIEKHIGDPADEIVRTASEGLFDLVVMGTHGHTALANLVLGSVATKVLARSKVPVLFMKA